MKMKINKLKSVNEWYELGSWRVMLDEEGRLTVESRGTEHMILKPQGAYLVLENGKAPLLATDETLIKHG